MLVHTFPQELTDRPYGFQLSVEGYRIINLITYSETFYGNIGRWFAIGTKSRGRLILLLELTIDLQRQSLDIKEVRPLQDLHLNDNFVMHLGTSSGGSQKFILVAVLGESSLRCVYKVLVPEMSERGLTDDIEHRAVSLLPTSRPGSRS
jgi:hypothetical protein